jgi:uncharacterized membrane protein
MPEEVTSTERDISDDLEQTAQKLSLAVSMVGLGLMLSGFLGTLIDGVSMAVPGVSVLSVPILIHVLREPLSLEAMSAGIILLALLPTARVLLALWLYLRQRNFLNVVAALIVFVELLLSMRVGG